MIEELIKELWDIREAKRELSQTEKDLNQRYDLAKRSLLELLNNQGLSSVKTTIARATVIEKEVVSVTDWDAFYTFVRENNAFHLLQKRPASNACKEQKTISGEAVPGTLFTTLTDISLSAA